MLAKHRGKLWGALPPPDSGWPASGCSPTCRRDINGKISRIFGLSHIDPFSKHRRITGFEMILAIGKNIAD